MKVKIINNTIDAKLDQVVTDIQGLPDAAYDEFVRNTPVRSGNARRRTSLRGDTIRADYPYAERLDSGYSRQSPKGMVEPTEKFIEKQLKKITGK